MNKTLKEYNKKLSELSLIFGPKSLFSPTLCRIEGQTNLFRNIFINNKKNKNQNFISLSLNFLKNFSFVLKPIRDFVFMLNSEKKVFPKNINRLFITYGDYRNISYKKNWEEEIFRGIKPSKKNKILVISLGKSIKDVVKNINYIKNCNQKKDIYSIYSMIELKDILNAFLKSNFYFFTYLFGLSSRKIFINRKNIKSFVIKSLINDYARGFLYSNCLFSNIWSNTLKNNPKKIIFPWESHCWERLLMHQVNKDKMFQTISTIGYQHTGFSYGLLQHFATKSDEKNFINPQIIFSCGEIQKEKLDQIEGLSKVRKFTVGSLRCKSNPDIKTLYSKLNKKIKNISVALGYNQKNYQTIIDELNKVNKKINIYIFLHPLNYKFNPTKYLDNNIILKYKRNNKLIKDSDLLIVDDNSMMIEGWTLGVPTIIYETDSYKLTKRDWKSPILHITKKNINELDKKNFRAKLDSSIKIYLKSKYYEKYFKEINFSKFENFLSQVN
ncbi:hypothetical protein [Prochlorococcus marinus]|jgi:hypothetical protein|nr:hypothetical protein [Prochlorococcus marinus]